MVGIESDVFRGGRSKSFCIHSRFDAEITEQRQAERLELLFGVVGQHRSIDQFEEHVGDVRPDAVAVQGVAAALVNDLALRVHDVVVFEEALADAEVVFLDLLLRALDRLSDHAMLDHIALDVAQSVHHFRHPVRGEEAHQIVLERHVELRRTRIPLAASTSAQLAVDAAAVVAFGADDGQTASGLDLIGEFDVRTTARHVGGDGHGAGLTGFSHDFSLALVELGVQHLVLDVPDVEHAREQFADLDRGRTHEDRSAGFAEGYDVIDDGVVLLALRFVDEVFAVISGNGSVGRDDHDVELVDVPQLSCFGFSGTRHARELVVHAEVVLKRDRGVGLRGRFHLYIFLRFDGLVQAVGVASAVHNAARLLVYDFDLVVHHHVVHVLLEQGVGLQQLVHGVDARTLNRVVGHQLALFFEFGFLVALVVVDGHQFRRQIRHGEEVLVLHVGRQELNALFRQLHLVLLLVDDEVELGIGFGHLALVVGEVDGLGLEQLLLHALEA